MASWASPMGSQRCAAHLARDREPLDYRTAQKAIHPRQKEVGRTLRRRTELRDHMLKEPDEHIRELRADEADAITPATRPDYDPFIAFARASGLRLRECRDVAPSRSG